MWVVGHHCADTHLRGSVAPHAHYIHRDYPLHCISHFTAPHPHITIHLPYCLDYTSHTPLYHTRTAHTPLHTAFTWPRHFTTHLHTRRGCWHTAIYSPSHGSFAHAAYLYTTTAILDLFTCGPGWLFPATATRRYTPHITNTHSSLHNIYRCRCSTVPHTLLHRLPHHLTLPHVSVLWHLHRIHHTLYFTTILRLRHRTVYHTALPPHTRDAHLPHHRLPHHRLHAFRHRARFAPRVLHTLAVPAADRVRTLPLPVLGLCACAHCPGHFTPSAPPWTFACLTCLSGSPGLCLPCAGSSPLYQTGGH